MHVVQICVGGKGTLPRNLSGVLDIGDVDVIDRENEMRLASLIIRYKHSLKRYT
jgi:hypothetical protein